jgi:predicted RNase H-like nuclease (RuvC/YqgF family)
VGDEDKNKNANQEDLQDEDGSEEPKTYDAEYVKKLKAEAKSYRQDKAQIKKEKEEIEARLKALEDEKLTEVEKDKKKIAELEKKLSDKEAEDKATQANVLITEALIGKPVVNVKAVKLLIREELAGEDVTADVVTKVVDKVLKENPYLLSSGAPNPSDGNFAKNNNEPAKDADKLMSDFLHGE